MGVWKDAPLRYTLALVRFAKIIDIGAFVGAFQAGVRARYPVLTDHSQQAFEIRVGPDGGPQVNLALQKTWQFAEADRGHALILGPEFLVLHAGASYQGHGDFISRLKEAVTVVRDIEGFNPVVTALGYRYIDLISPKQPGETLATYLQPWVMPVEGSEWPPSGLNLMDSVYVLGFRTEVGILRLQALRRPPTTMPPDLDTPLVRENGWVATRPSGDFALLDCDHALTFPSAEGLDISVIGEGLNKLSHWAGIAFKSAVTPHALKVWEEGPQ